jgi:translocation and assembly module TamB
MSDDLQRDDPLSSPEVPVPADEPISPAPRRWSARRAVLWVFGPIVALLLVAVLLLNWYTTTDDFQQRVGGEVVQVLENATGGRIELQHLRFNLWHLAIEADGLVIHGTEAPGQLPYLSAAKIQLRLHINMVLTHIRGLGPQSRISLRYLRVDQPRMHLIVDKDGHTNAPTPRHPSTSTTPLQDTLLDLQARKVELADGLIVYNDQAIPFDLQASQLNAQITYLRKTDRYGADIDLADLETKMQHEPLVRSRLHLKAELGRDVASLDSLDFTTGATTHLQAKGELNHFAHPLWTMAVAGGVEVRQLQYLVAVPGLDAGVLELSAQGHSCEAQPSVPAHPTKHHFFSRGTQKTGVQAHRDANSCANGFLITGSVKLHDVGYRNEYVRFYNINGHTQLRVTPQLMRFDDFLLTLPKGGSARGDMQLEDWLASSAGSGVSATAATHTHALITATVDRIPLRTIMDSTAPEHYGDLGFDTSISGPATVEWDASSPSVADTVQVEADLNFLPVGLRRPGVAASVPVTGHVHGHYDGAREVVRISQLNLESPATTLTGSGILGVNVGDPLTALQVNLATHDLGEFDQLLKTLDFRAQGKKGLAAVPVLLHGSMNFAGSARGEIANLDLKGHLEASDLALQLSDLADIQIDTVVGDAEFSPNGGIAIASSTIHRGDATLNLEGSFRPRRVGSARSATYVWDEQLGIDARAQLQNASVDDLLQIAGQQTKIPVTGTMNFDLHGTGTVKDIVASGSITMTNGVAYGEPYQRVALQLAMQGQQISAHQIVVQAHDMRATGDGGYNLATHHILANLSAADLQLSKFDTFRKAAPEVAAIASVQLHVDGVMSAPNLQAKLALQQVQLRGTALGDAQATAYSTGSKLFYDARANLVGAQLAATGQTMLTGEYQTQAELKLSSMDVAKVMAVVAPGAMQASSNIAGTINVQGPAAHPEQMTGSAELHPVQVTLQGIQLQASGPLHASLDHGKVTLTPAHITGEDTDLRVGGTAVVFGDPNPMGGPLQIDASGSISVALLHTFDSSIVSSGRVQFDLVAAGRVKKPSVHGKLQMQNVNIAVDGIPNGLSDMNGTLVFNEDRLDIEKLTATTGGGQVKLGGYVAYQNGLFADLTAMGDTVRVRYSGLSATANASLRLQGGPQSLLLSGNVLVTRFGVGADVDFAAFAATGSVQAPPDPSSLLNKVRMDVHITSAPQLDFQNSYAKLAGAVDLNLRGTLAVPSLLGRIQITDGSATFAGTHYQLQRGNIYFGNPVRIDPTIDLDATARVENYDITIGLHGTATSIKPTYRSEPPLSEADIFNLLALGRTQEEAQLYQEQQTQAGTDPTTSALLGGALNATVSSRVGKLFGAGSVKIDPAFVGTLGNSSARITVQEPLSKQLTLVFATNVNETAEQLIQVQYQLNENNAIWITRDESGVFSIVYKIRKRYR